MTQKEVFQSAMQFTEWFFVCVLKGAKNCVHVIIVISKWCRVFLFVHILSPGLLYLLCSAHLSFLPLLWFRLFSHLYLCLFVFSIWAGQQSFREIQSNLSRFDYYFTVYPVGLSSTPRLPDFQIGHSVQWHIFPGRRRVPKFTSEPFTVKDRGHKSSTHFLNNLLPCICDNKCPPCSYFTPLNPKLHTP